MPETNARLIINHAMQLLVLKKLHTAAFKILLKNKLLFSYYHDLHKVLIERPG